MNRRPGGLGVLCPWARALGGGVTPLVMSLVLRGEQWQCYQVQEQTKAPVCVCVCVCVCVPPKDIQSCSSCDVQHPTVRRIISKTMSSVWAPHW